MCTAPKPKTASPSQQLVQQVEEISSLPDSTKSIGQAPIEHATQQVPATTPSPRPFTKRTATKQKDVSEQVPEQGPVEAQTTTKKAKTTMTPAAKLAYFLQRSVVRGKVVRTEYFQEQGLEVFLERLRAQGWLSLFTNTQMGCSVPELVEFYANCVITDGVVISKVKGKEVRFDAQKLGEILGVPATGFDLYVREDKSVLRAAHLLELTQKLSQQIGLQTPKFVKKGDMISLNQLLLWFIIKNVTPRGQGRNLADAMDQCFIDLMDRGEQINLPAIMIRHLARMKNTSREHNIGYGLLLTLVLEHFGVSLQKRVGVQMTDEIGSSTLVVCGFKLGKREQVASE